MNTPASGLGKEVPENAYIVINAQIFPIRNLITTIGRKLDNDLVLQDPSISRYHAEIRYEDSQFILYDLGSSGGIAVNNKKVKQNVLFSGDIILISKTPMMFMYEGASIKSLALSQTGELNSSSQPIATDKPNKLPTGRK